MTETPPKEDKQLTPAEKEHLERVDEINKRFQKQILFINIVLMIVKIMLAVVWILLFYVLFVAGWYLVKIKF
jgi:hypothetical protein